MPITDMAICAICYRRTEYPFYVGAHCRYNSAIRALSSDEIHILEAAVAGIKRENPKVLSFDI
jgi:hypothetical protein